MLEVLDGMEVVRQNMSADFTLDEAFHKVGSRERLRWNVFALRY